MTTPFLYNSSSLDLLRIQESLVKPTTSADATYNATDTRSFTRDTTDQQQQHLQSIPEISSMPFLSEVILSNWLQSECNSQAQSPVISIQPIHHTLENATITYDTLVEQQKELVKDVFFSPAMSSINKSTASVTLPSARTRPSVTSPSVYAFTHSSCSDDDTFYGSQTDAESLEDDFSPSELLLEQDNASLFFGALDFELEQQQQQQQQYQLPSTAPPVSPSSSVDTASTTTTISPINHHHSPSLLKRKREADIGNGAPFLSRKRNPWPSVASPKSTPPMSPNENRWDYFDASGEDSSTDDDTASTSHDYRTMKSDFQFISVQDVNILEDDNEDDDDDISTYWENRRAYMFDQDSSKNKPVLHNKLSKRTLTTTTKKSITTSTITIKKQKQHKKSKLSPVSTSNTGCPCLENHDHLEKVDPRPTCHPTLYEKLTKANVDWCRYCGTTEGVNWRPGPWGKRTLCNKHGCDYKGYGFACKLPRLNLTGYVHESLHDRDRPVLQFYCAACHRMESWVTNMLVRCEGCYKSYHQKCYHGHQQPLTDAFVAGNQPWFCEDTCVENVACRRVVVEISRKRLPLMRAPIKNQVQQPHLLSNKQYPQYTFTSTDSTTRNIGVGRETN